MPKVLESLRSWNVNVTRAAKRKSPIRVLLVDDSSLMHQWLQAVLSSQRRFKIVGVARSEVEAYRAIETCRPDIMVLDVQLGGGRGIDICRVIRQSHPNIPVLFLATSDDKTLIHAAIRAGAQGYLLKNASNEAIAAGMEVVSIGQAIAHQRY